MSITLVTGVPGSGKTLMAVWDLLRPLVGAVEKKTDERGDTIEIPRTIFTNVNGLLLEHQMIEGGGSWSMGADKKWKYEGNPEGLRNWHNWAKPGSVVCFDEFQKFWPPRPNGAAVPPDIQTLDTHRHMGVDFILVTQNCNNVDRHILGLVDRHLHIRRVSNMPMAVVYEWDHASRALNYKNSMTKSPWRYPKQAYKLYKSAELHTKQKRKMPGLVWFILAGFAGAAYAWPTLTTRFDERVHGKPVAAAAAPVTVKPGEKVEYTKDGTTYTVESVTTPPVPAPEAALVAPAVVLPQIAGCIVVRDRCGCFDATGQKVPAEPAACLESAGVNGTPKADIVEEAKPRPFDVSEGEALAYLRELKTRR
ncbi:MAG: zonular occludens toxin domain-containing protein [Undibacterium sp.]|uniref:zonular occludens toxin domain-containing protein n=1 Tax=Undibacterium sp. TaxID=1914977 RepID=UPI0027288E85|nr:zonular occludens toxin domain-containing protein [Undibacterium sp.]MDO8652072.1 zonular occludens toxin domain-containing protein [Undibacterium sp.]